MKITLLPAFTGTRELCAGVVHYGVLKPKINTRRVNYVVLKCEPCNFTLQGKQARFSGREIFEVVDLK